MGVWLGPMGNGNGLIKKKSDINYTDTFDFYIDNNTGNWEIRLTKSGNLKFKKNPGDIDVFLVGYGQSGKQGGLDTGNSVKGGRGGYGGQCINHTFTNINKNSIYPVKIGVESTGEDTSIFDTIAYGGGKTISNQVIGHQGGIGAYAYLNGDNYSSTSAPVPGAENGAALGILAFNNTTSYFCGNHYFGSGGGGGGATWYKSSLGDHAMAAPGSGADNYAGTGGEVKISPSLEAKKGDDATPNTGCGGGGGGAIIQGFNSMINNVGGSGSNGVIIIRNNRGTIFS